MDLTQLKAEKKGPISSYKYKVDEKLLKLNKKKYKKTNFKNLLENQLKSKLIDNSSEKKIMKIPFAGQIQLDGSDYKKITEARSKLMIEIKLSTRESKNGKYLAIFSNLANSNCKEQTPELTTIYPSEKTSVEKSQLFMYNNQVKTLKRGQSQKTFAKPDYNSNFLKPRNKSTIKKRPKKNFKHLNEENLRSPNCWVTPQKERESLYDELLCFRNKGEFKTGAINRNFLTTAKKDKKKLKSVVGYQSFESDSLHVDNRRDSREELVKTKEKFFDLKNYEGYQLKTPKKAQKPKENYVDNKNDKFDLNKQATEPIGDEDTYLINNPKINLNTSKNNFRKVVSAKILPEKINTPENFLNFITTLNKNLPKRQSLISNFNMKSKLSLREKIDESHNRILKLCPRKPNKSMNSSKLSSVFSKICKDN